ncbi:sporulation-delaying protein SdpB family protein [Melghirimyces algeriensis]|uniref:Antimicrobial peptide system protein, SdpB family n=1 Tax=Melghirimyces algeriensis TaxID=910412 RepID=A0A521DEK7_9BACL|nr:sporulation-delaying protein SdpB family protein [Melghirimyces algeriensis]SMO70028.1 antimicrobial peptide system protein, SdpB family [Melghirimyces algeriensis]
MHKKISFIITKWKNHFPWTNVYGLARSIIALSSMLTLLFNSPEVLFKPSSLTNDFPSCTTGYSIFCLGQNNYVYLDLIRWTCVIFLFFVIIGWRPRITGIIHWYISYSMQMSLVVIDGGEQAAAVITFLLIPLTLTDPRKWHWDINYEGEKHSVYFKIIANISYFFIRLQVAVLYFHSTVAKLKNKEWIDGTAVYYYSHEKTVGFNHLLGNLSEPIVTSPLVILPTWGTLIIQLVLFGAFFTPKKYWSPLFVIAITMHEIFALMLGLISFSMIMFGILILYLVPIDKKLELDNILFRKYNLNGKYILLKEKGGID